MRKTLAGLLAVLVPSAASAHLSIKVDLFAPGGTRYEVHSADSMTSGNMPAGGGIVYLEKSVEGYHDHAATVDVWAVFTTAGGAQVQCQNATAGVYEPAWHYKTTCRPTFQFDGAACSSSCPVVPLAPPTNNAKAFPNPMRRTDDAVQFVNLPPNARVKIYSPAGRLVYEKTIGIQGAMHWHTEDLSGRMVGTGVYQVVAQGDGRTATLKIAIQR